MNRILSFLLILRTYWRSLLFILVVLTTLLLGCLHPTHHTPRKWFQMTGFYFILVSFGLWGFVLLPQRWDFFSTLKFMKRHLLAMLLATLLVAVALMNCPPNFRVLADETNLVGMSMAMYDVQSFQNPTQGYYYYHKFVEISHTWDKRPLLYPFLIFIVHVLKGYSAYNGFIVNAVAGWFSFFLTYLLLRRRFDSFHANIGMVLLASFPVHLIWMGSSGFETVNLCFMLLSFLLLDHYLETGSLQHLTALGFTLVLLAQCRYESAVFTLIFSVILLFGFSKKTLKNLPLLLILLPLLYLPVIWQRVYGHHSYQLKADAAAFGWEYFVANCQNAWRYFSSRMELHGSNPALFFLGAIGIGGYFTRMIGNRGSISRHDVMLILSVLLSFLSMSGILFSYYWGDITKQYSIRFAIVFLPLMVIGATIFVHWSSRVLKSYKRLTVVGIVTLFFLSVPVAGKNRAVKELVTQRLYTHALAFLFQHYAHNNILVVSDRSGMYTVHRFGAVNFGYATSQKNQLLAQLNNRLFQEMVVIQKIAYSNHQPISKHRLPSDYRLETLHESQLKGAEYIRFSRVKLSKEP